MAGSTAGRGHERDRLATEDDRDRARLSLGPVLLGDDAAGLMAQDPETQAIRPLHAGAIGAVVGEPTLRVAHDDEVAGTDVAAAIA